VEDHHVDRPDVDAQQCVQLTGTNRSFDLIALVAKATLLIVSVQYAPDKKPRVSAGGLRPFRTLEVQCAIPRLPKASFASKKTVLCRPGGPCKVTKTRSHPELGRQTP
jgi:hypothetical protein